MQKIDIVTIWYLLLVGLFLPYLAIRSARRQLGGAPLPPRPQIWRSVLIMEMMLLAIAVLTARFAYIELFSAGQIDLGIVLITTAMLAVALVLQRLIWRATDGARRALLLQSRPHTYGEMGWWTAISIAAGTVEEIAYRGVMPCLLVAALQRWSGNLPDAWTEPLAGDFSTTWWIAVAFSVAAFAFAHFGQGLHRTLFFIVFSVACHLLVRVSGSLYPAMALHVLYDVAAGLAAIRFSRSLSESR